MTIDNVTFLDSLNYLQMPLRALPKAFGFDNKITKGFFPHLFNTPENINYEGPLPDMKYYSPDAMPNKERESFISWYNEQKQANYIFNFQKEFIHYCRADVIVLRRACIAFKDMILKCGNVCPFSECCTLASTCSRIFRNKFLKADTIGILPPRGEYRWSSNQSSTAISWLIFQEEKCGHIIDYTPRRKKIWLPCGTLVDGYYHNPETQEKIVFQFHGCYWHGCTMCYRVSRYQQLRTSETFDQRLELTRAASNRIRSTRYTLIKKWDCNFRKFLKNNPSLEISINSYPLLQNTPLKLRDAFFGRRRENFVILRNANGSEKIKYVDVCLLYPYVCKTGRFPVGHPTIHVGTECDGILKNRKYKKI
ncbi:uncharacterized protein [Chelonus insularis]|uniref:uncharacterized protein n=1 Tax=Chelonus insularis TaxID=460826 RepID=UPI00158F6085|nr:uncharacterized protein LOC118068314 [Chelonus insularis]